jgi:tetratricopeptide (TPR) repeat protein
MTRNPSNEPTVPDPEDMQQESTSTTQIIVNQVVHRIGDAGKAVGVAIGQVVGDVTVVLNINLFEPLIAFLNSYWPVLVVIFVAESIVLVAYRYLDQTFWIRQWVLILELILVFVIASSLYTVKRRAKSPRRWKPGAALAFVAFLVFLLVDGWQVYWVLESPWRAIAVAQFDDSKATDKSDVQKDIITTMTKAGIPDEEIVRLGLISSPKSAIRLGRKYKAKIVIWGWYNNLEIHPSFEVIKHLPRIDLPETYKGTTEDELARFQIYLARDLPSEYTVLGFLTLGVIDYYDGKYNGSLRILDKAEDQLEKLPETGRTVSPRVLYLFRGNALRQLNRFGDAVGQFDRAIAEDPDSGDAVAVFVYNQRGLAYLSLGEREKAIADFDKALEWEPEQGTVLYNRGSAYYGLDQFNAALADFDQALEVRPLTRWVQSVYVMRSATYSHLGRYDEAVADADRAIELAPDVPDGYFVQGVAYLGLGNSEMAIEETGKAIELDPKYVGAYYQRGKSLERSGDFRAARADYQTVIDLCSDIGEYEGVYTVHCERYEEEALNGVQRLETQQL